jgi:outer membrane protein assembly factor BamB
MNAENTTVSQGADPAQFKKLYAGGPRLWLPLTLVTLFWLGSFVVSAVDKPYFDGFLYALASSGLLLLLFLAWWLTNRRVTRGERLYGLALVLGTGVLAFFISHKSVGFFGVLTLGLPLALTTWTLLMAVVKKMAFTWKRLGTLAVFALTWAPLIFVRIDGVDSDLRGDVRWRWATSSEDLFLAEKACTRSAETLADRDTQTTVLLSPGDWPEFRGPDRDGVIHGVRISTDWRTAPPRLLWRQRVGPAWSSVIVIGKRLFTQEQRGDEEAVVCYEAGTGKEIWSHTDTYRFWDAVSGAGPRATPTFFGGRIYALGGTGILTCLDAATGKPYWRHDLPAKVAAPTPLWGFSASPLVIDDKVIVFAGGKTEKTLWAYRADSGEPAWSAPAGAGSYSSPQAARLAGKRQCLMLTDDGLSAFAPDTGALLWKHGRAMPGAPRTAQPHLLGEDELLVASLAGPGVVRLKLSQDGEALKPEEIWPSTDLKPEFPDLVVHEGHAYGFDVNIFCCIDLATGKRSWKAGRYGRGQVMLLADQGLLLVLSETGEAVLLAANPKRHEEVGRFQALHGKTWNHPVIAHGRLYARNAEEMACYELKPAQAH